MGLRLVAYTATVKDGIAYIENSEGDTVYSNDPLELLNFIGEIFDDPEREKPDWGLKVAWDLDTFISVILKRLPLESVKELARKDHCVYMDSDCLPIAGAGRDSEPESYHKLSYIAGKFATYEVKIGAQKSVSFMYHLCQYFDDEPDVTDVIKIHTKASLLIDEMRNLGLNPKALISPINIYEKEFLSRMQVPTLLDLPNLESEEIIDYAEECAGKAWISAFQVGHWDIGEAWDYDLRAAYPSITAGLYNFKYAKFEKLNHLPEKGAHWGFLRGKLTIYDHVTVSPIIRRIGKELRSDVGTWEDTITLDELAFIRQWHIGEFKMQDGWFITFTAPVKPYEIPITRLFGQRSHSYFANKWAKRMANGIPGLWLHKNDREVPSKYYNPPYAAIVHSRTRLKVADFIYRNKLVNNLISVDVDGIKVDREVKGVGMSNKMGEWALHGIGGVLVISPGRIYTGAKKPHGLNYDMILQMINEHPKESYYVAKSMRRQTLAESITQNDLAHLGELREFQSAMDLNVLRAQQDREFPKYPRNGGELLANKYTSKPLKA